MKYGYCETPQLHSLMDKMIKILPRKINERWWGVGHDQVFLSPRGKERVEALTILASLIAKRNSNGSI